MYSGGIRGNGKTLTATYYAYRDYQQGRKVLTNYKTLFSEIMTTKDMVNYIFESELRNVTVVIDEIQVILNSIGTKGTVLKFVEQLLNQSRKRNVDIWYTTQRYLNVHVRLRQQTDVLLEPYKLDVIPIPGTKKYKIDTSHICTIDSCDKHHLIVVKSKVPFVVKPISMLKAWKVGNLYDTNEIINEKIIL
jgi:hypothetical protein